MIQEYKAKPEGKSLVDQSFDILNKVSQSDYTKWSIVYDISDKKIYFKTEKFQQVKSVSFSFFNFSCNTASKVLDMNRAEQGNMSTYFANYSTTTNNLILEKTIKQSSPPLEISHEEIEAIKSHPDTIHCK